MATHDYNIANQGFPAFRSDLNNALSAIVSNNSNSSAPSTTYAYQWWYDVSTTTLKFRNADNDAWISFATFDMANDTVNLVDSAIDVVTDTSPQLGGTLDTNGNLIQFGDSSGASDDRLQFGASQDLQIYHDGTNNYVMGTTSNNLYLGSNSNTGITIDSSGNAIFDFGVLANEGSLTDGATIAWDVNTAPVCKVTLGGNRTLSAPTNQAGSGQFISILVIQDSTGSRTLTWNAIFEFKDDTAPTLTTTGGKGDLFIFRYYGTGSKWIEVGRNQNLSLS